MKYIDLVELNTKNPEYVDLLSKLFFFNRKGTQSYRLLIYINDKIIDVANKPELFFELIRFIMENGELIKKSDSGHPLGRGFAIYKLGNIYAEIKIHGDWKGYEENSYIKLTLYTQD